MAWMTAGEALAALGTRPQTLYANVSRGRIEAKPDPADPRRSLYSAADVKRLAARRRRLKSETLAADAIRWGDPVLSSALSTVQRGRLFYRGRDAVALASHATLEDVAALLWRAPTVDFSREPLKRGALDAETPTTRAFLALSALAGAALPTLGRSESALHAEACAVVSAMADAMLRDDARARRRSLHERIAAAWAKPKAADKIRRALVLLADHDLNASTFAARVAASTGASLAACALSGLATLTGPRHGGASAAAQAFAASAARDGVGAAVRAWLAQGRAIPAFGHRLYPDGDARAAALMDSFTPTPLFAELAEAGAAATGEKPNIDFALAAMTAWFKLPREAPIVLFALSRCAGWLAHALEQAANGDLIRPRARYVGPPLSLSDRD